MLLAFFQGSCRRQSSIFPMFKRFAHIHWSRHSIEVLEACCNHVQLDLITISRLDRTLQDTTYHYNRARPAFQGSTFYNLHLQSSEQRHGWALARYSESSITAAKIIIANAGLRFCQPSNSGLRTKRISKLLYRNSCWDHPGFKEDFPYRGSYEIIRFLS